MRDSIEFARDWIREGKCVNDTGKEMTICVDGKPRKLAPGEETPSATDCDGIIHEDGSATKIWGKSRIPSHRSKEWVEKNWPACRKETKDTSAPPRPGIG